MVERGGKMNKIEIVKLWERWKFLLPWSVIINRIFTAPVLIWEAREGHPGILFLIAFSGAFFGDVFDGVISRFLKVSNATLRQGDSFADVCLYTAVVWSSWRTFPQVILEYKSPLLALLCLQMTLLVASLWKYRRPVCYHTYSAKAWGLFIYIAAMCLFLTHQGGWSLWLMIGVGILHTLEETAMTLILPTWNHDVLSLFHALKLAKSTEASAE